MKKLSTLVDELIVGASALADPMEANKASDLRAMRRFPKVKTELLRRITALEQKAQDADDSACGWNVDDVLQEATVHGLALTRVEAKAVLARMACKGDASIGFSWDTIDYFIGELKVGRKMSFKEAEAADDDGETRCDSPRKRAGMRLVSLTSRAVDLLHEAEDCSLPHYHPGDVINLRYVPQAYRHRVRAEIKLHESTNQKAA